MQHIKILTFIAIFCSIACDAIVGQKNKKLLPYQSVVDFQKIETTQKIVSTLASDNFNGRNIKDGSIELTKNFLEQMLKKSGIKPLIGGEYRNKYKFADNFLAENIVGVIDNIAPKNEYILLCANYDHVGVEVDYDKGTSDQIYNGANDNASGCAVLIQVAKYLAQFKFEKKVLIVFFSGKFYGNFGAGYFADYAKRNNVNIKAVLNFEMLGHQLSGKPAKVYMYDQELSNLSSEINFALGEKFIEESIEAQDDDNVELEPNQDHLPFYNVYKIPSNTITTFDPHTDSTYMTVRDDENHIDFVNLHKITNKITYALYHILYHNIEFKIMPKPGEKEEEENNH